MYFFTDKTITYGKLSEIEYILIKKAWHTHSKGYIWEKLSHADFFGFKALERGYMVSMQTAAIQHTRGQNTINGLGMISMISGQDLMFLDRIESLVCTTGIDMPMDMQLLDLAMFS